ncbi:MAG TPA: hypothetical protein VMR75_00905 [Candidatus Saccharimonadales bacterium]|nr:hypothetical protein [Candidatus Saccharimonadales bacterium]
MEAAYANTIRATARSVGLGFGLFFLLLGVCMLLLPQGIKVNEGLSYYGTHSLTVVPYGLAFFALCFGTWRASNILSRGAKQLRFAIFSARLIVILMLGVLLTPNTVNFTFEQLHVIVGSLVFVVQVILGFWFAVKLRTNFITWVLLLVQLFCMAVAYEFLTTLDGYLIAGQFGFQLAFAILVVHGLLHPKFLTAPAERSSITAPDSP